VWRVTRCSRVRWRHPPARADAGEDGRLRADLLADEKERAEHVMLVTWDANDSVGWPRRAP